MKKLVLFLSLAALIAGFASAQIAKGNSAWVSAKTVTLKSSTWFFASSRGTLACGDQVTVLQVSGNWAEVRSASGVSGWMPVSSLTSKRITPSMTASASASEIALAGKGFNEEVENAYKASGKLDYADVDATEAIAVSTADLYKFMTDGHLAAGQE